MVQYSSVSDMGGKYWQDTGIFSVFRIGAVAVSFDILGMYSVYQVDCPESHIQEKSGGDGMLFGNSLVLSLCC